MGTRRTTLTTPTFWNSENGTRLMISLQRVTMLSDSLQRVTNRIPPKIDIRLRPHPPTGTDGTRLKLNDSFQRVTKRTRLTSRACTRCQQTVLKEQVSHSFVYMLWQVHRDQVRRGDYYYTTIMQKFARTIHKLARCSKQLIFNIMQKFATILHKLARCSNQLIFNIRYNQQPATTQSVQVQQLTNKQPATTQSVQVQQLTNKQPLSQYKSRN